MLKRLEMDTKPKTTAYFGHSASIQLFLTALGALKDEIDLKADNFPEMSNRKWKTSTISPFAANIAVVRYSCPKNDRVKFFLNEKVLHLDWCTSNGECDWQHMNRKYSYFTRENCEQTFCHTEL